LTAEQTDDADATDEKAIPVAIAPQKTVEAAVSAALTGVKQCRRHACHHRRYFGAREATILDTNFTNPHELNRTLL
jgi:hypothetical protein